MKEEIYTDKDGHQYVLDDQGNRRPPMKIESKAPEDEFRTYDTSEGHCALCGKLNCNGGCFK